MKHPAVTAVLIWDAGLLTGAVTNVDALKVIADSGELAGARCGVLREQFAQMATLKDVEEFAAEVPTPQTRCLGLLIAHSAYGVCLYQRKNEVAGTDCSVPEDYEREQLMQSILAWEKRQDFPRRNSTLGRLR